MVNRKQSWKLGLLFSFFLLLFIRSFMLINETAEQIIEPINLVTNNNYLDEEHTYAFIKKVLEKHNKTINIYWMEDITSFHGKYMLRVPEQCPLVDNCAYAEYYPHLEEPNEYVRYDIDWSPKLASADGLVFHLPQYRMFPQGKKPDHQKWIAFTMESLEMFGKWNKPEWRSQIDYSMTYKLNSDILTGYFSSNLSSFLIPPLPKTEPVPIAYVASHCVKHRDEYVTSLQKYIQVDSYGSCIHNKDWPDISKKTGKQKRETIARYKFYLAFENRNENDYVTEKFFEALYVGTVPIVMGASNVHLFAPSNHSYIDVRDFSSPKELAEYVQFLMENDDEYQKYLDWKKQPSQQFLNLIARQKLDSRCRLCIRLAADFVETQLGRENMFNLHF